MSKRIHWSDFKTFVDDRKVPIHESSLGSDYLLEAFDGPVYRECKVSAGSADHTDYTTNYQAAANISMTDSNGIMLSRVKVTESGWAYQAHTVEFETGVLSSLYNKDHTEADLGLATLKCYNSSGTEMTTQLNATLGAVETVIDWEPDFDYEIIGGTFYQANVPATDVRMWVIAAPDIPAAYGGSVHFLEGGINLKMIGSSQSINTDGRTSKKLIYVEGTGSTKLRLVVRHGIGVTAPILIRFDIFRPIG